MTASFQAKDPFSQETVQPSKHDPTFSRILVAHEIWASRISLQVASTAGRTKRHCGIATDLGHRCGC